MPNQPPSEKRKIYNSTPQDRKWALAVGVLYVLLAIGLGYMLFKIWPPVPWPDADKHPQAIARAMKECPTPTPTPTVAPAASVISTPTPGATVTPPRNATPTPAPNATATPITNDAGAKPVTSPSPSPSPTPVEAVAMPISFPFVSQCVMTTFDERLLLLVMVAGMLGSFIHGATSLADYVGNNRFSRRWTWFYILRPVIGMALALVFYFVIRGGFLTTNVGATDMFSKQATDKLSEVFTTLFRSGEGDDKRADPLDPNVSADTLTADPPNATAGGDAFTLTVNGTGFVEDCKITFDDIEQPTTFDSATSLTTQVAKETIATARVIKLGVNRPDGTKYLAVDFNVNAPEGGGVAAPPTITSLDPPSGSIGAEDRVVTVNGTNFVEGNTVHVDGAPQPTTFVSATELTADLDQALLSTARTLKFKVVTDAGTESAETDFPVS